MIERYGSILIAEKEITPEPLPSADGSGIRPPIKTAVGYADEDENPSEQHKFSKKEIKRLRKIAKKEEKEAKKNKKPA